jgi:nucleotide-binding universal stress UspA family protein
MGQLFAGVLLGPSVLGVVWPEAQQALFPAGREQKAMLEAVSDLGILMLLLLTGMETDLKLVRRARRAAGSVSAAGIALPFALGVTLGQLLPDSMLPRPDQRLITSRFLGTALSVASIKIVATVVREMKFTRRKVGMTLLASAIIDDAEQLQLSGEGRINILAPVRGNKVSRRAAEVALAIAKMSNSPMTALYVLGTVGSDQAEHKAAAQRETDQQEKPRSKHALERGSSH